MSVSDSGEGGDEIQPSEEVDFVMFTECYEGKTDEDAEDETEASPENRAVEDGNPMERGSPSGAARGECEENEDVKDAVGEDETGTSCLKDQGKEDDNPTEMEFSPSGTFLKQYLYSETGTPQILHAMSPRPAGWKKKTNSSRETKWMWINWR